MTTVTAKPSRRIAMRLPRASTVLACLVYAYLVVPSLVVMPISLSEAGEFTLDKARLSLNLFRQFFGSEAWLAALWNSLQVATAASVLATLIGIPAAYAFARGRFLGRSTVQMLVISPMFVPVIVIALGLYFLAAATGQQGRFSTLVLAHAMYGLPFVVMLVLSGMTQVDPALEKAAMLMGASPARVFLQVVLPQLKIPIFAGFLFAFLASFDEVVIAWFLNGPTTITLPVKMYSSIMWENTPVIAAVSTMLTLLSFAVCLLTMMLGANPGAKGAEAGR
ncbi:MAG TPA: ABC transporter permease [Bosea sp. (in: a-proteobacteria)]|jgi:putative spermidine/putrescine transport system permease protein|uniref:ABC transporter permease n=1 Tax=Bosea sp. (in: a-proteobacteria) TaxID=1871050 RepID=UPI002E1520C0|nr:ABC transporter permease [Bosea sp. (in: a-proteobacteria)]